MQVYEIRPLIEKAYLKNRDSWEQTRLISGYMHKAWFKGDAPPMTFPWDADKKEQVVTRQQHDSLIEKMKAEEKKMKKHGK